MRVISILSGKGGVGKTTTVANLGLALSMVFNKKVVLLDGNSTTPDLGLHLGMYSFPHTLEDVLRGEVSITDALYHHPHGVSILPSALSINTAEVDLRDLKDHYKALEGYDIVLLDSPPGLGKRIAPTIDITDEILIVTNPEIPAITDALRLVEIAKIAGVPITGVVLNRVRQEKYELSMREVESVFDMPMTGSIPEDARVRESIALGSPIVSNSPYSPAAIGFKKLAGSLIGLEYRVGFLDRLRSWLGFGRETPVRQMRILVNAMEKPAKEEIILKKPVPERRVIEEPIEKKIILEKPVPEAPVIEETPEPEATEAPPVKPRKPVKRIITVEKAMRVPRIGIGFDWSRFIVSQYKSWAPSELLGMGVEVIQGVDADYREKLMKAGYNTVRALSKAEVEDVMRKVGLSAPIADYFIAVSKAIATAASK